MKYLFLTLFFLVITKPVNAQFYPTQYRPPNLNWQQLLTPHFRIVFPKGEDSVAFRMGRILEHEYGEIQNLVGGELTDFPFVLNNYNDLSNGFVSPLNFRSEIEIPTDKGKAMNPQSGNWLETVAPHELVHALHFNNLDGFLANFLQLASPDIARTLHSAVPQGVLEGVATYHETKNVAPNEGRGNYPYFYNQFNATFADPDHRWSLGQMLSFPSYTRPFNRYYIGGFEFTNWLQDTYGPNTTKDAIDFYIRWPFLGYGVALKHATDLWPGQLYSRFEDNYEKELVSHNPNSYESLPISFKGKEIRRPLWISDNQLLMFGSFYNARPGFYTYDLTNGLFELIIETRTVQDFIYDLSEDRSRLLFSNYRSSARYNNTFKTDLYEADLSTGQTTRFSTGLRAFAPVYLENSILALQTDHESSTLIHLDYDNDDYSPETLAAIPNTEFVNVQPNPVNLQQFAIVANRRGLQALWIADKNSLKTELLEPPDVSFSRGSLFDPFWHPSGKKVLFSSDHTGTSQIYEYNRSDREIKQITDAPFNAMEASYSPDGKRIAFIVQQKNERVPVVLDSEEFMNKTVPVSEWKPSENKQAFLNRPELGSDLIPESKSWGITPYRPGLSWLKPRTIFPDISEVSGTETYQIGIGLYGVDLLQKNSYTLDASVVQNLFWYNLKYRHTGFFPGIRFNVFNDPRFPVMRFRFPNESFQDKRMLRQDLGFSVNFPFRYVLENNSRFSSISFSPEFKIRGTRFYELDHDGNPASDFATSFSGNLYSVLNYKLQQNIRDVQPNAGLVFYSELEHFFNTDSTYISTLNNRFLFKFSQPTAFRAGLFVFTSPLRHLNQSLRIGIEGMTQTGNLFFNQDLVSNGFSESIFPGSQNMLSFSTRYTAPLFYPDNGGFLLPFYLSSVYMVGFTDTIVDLERTGSLSDFYTGSRTVYGLGLRCHFRISNLAIGLGLAFAVEPMRGNTNWFIGNF